MRRGIVVLAALVTGAVAACAEPRAGTLPPPSPSTVPSPTQSATPDLATSLRDALRGYFDALYAAGMDPANKTDELEALIHPSCSCRRVVEVLRKQATQGRHVDYTYQLRDIKVIDVTERAGTVRYTVRQSAGALRDRSGRVVDSYPASTDTYSAQFTRTPVSWLLRRVDAFS